jgi:L-serine deaminase
MHQFRSQMSRHGIGQVELLWRNETVLPGLDAAQVSAGLNGIIDAMESAAERGIVTETILSGPIGLARKASVILQPVVEDSRFFGKIPHPP